MKYKVSVIKKIAFLVMTMALAVALVACSGAAGVAGPARTARRGRSDARIRRLRRLRQLRRWSRRGPVQTGQRHTGFHIQRHRKDGMDTMAQSVDVSEYFSSIRSDVFACPTLHGANAS